MDYKDELVEEYTTLRGFDLPVVKADKDRMFDSVVQHLHINLLADLSPPWMAKKFLQALPGEGFLCRYLVPTFMQWDIETAARLFGEYVANTMKKVAEAAALQVTRGAWAPAVPLPKLQRAGGDVAFDFVSAFTEAFLLP